MPLTLGCHLSSSNESSGSSQLQPLSKPSVAAVPAFLRNVVHDSFGDDIESEVLVRLLHHFAKLVFLRGVSTTVFLLPQKLASLKGVGGGLFLGASSLTVVRKCFFLIAAPPTQGKWFATKDKITTSPIAIVASPFPVMQDAPPSQCCK
jgi:hypothetical protein